MIKVKELELKTNLIEVCVIRKPFTDSYMLKREEVIKRFGDYRVINSIIRKDKISLMIQED